ncbi:MAG TPA: hypothetical protein VGY31_14955 [Terriglobia bacterium]|nr:hypothetical protein [Terriglobia bacterium]
MAALLQNFVITCRVVVAVFARRSKNDGQRHLQLQVGELKAKFPRYKNGSQSWQGPLVQNLKIGS